MILKSRNKAYRTKKQAVGLSLLLVILSMLIAFTGAKYVSDIEVTKAVSLTATTEFTIDKSKMHTALKNLTTKPTTLKFVKGNDTAISGLESLTSAGIQDDTLHSGKIGVFQSTDGNTVYIAPMTTDGKSPADTDKAMYTPQNSFAFLAGGESYTNLGSNLTSIDCANLDTSRATDMSGFFWDLTALESLSVSSFDTSKVTTMEGMFRSCQTIQTLDLSSFNTSNVMAMNNMFNDCESLTDLTISSFNTSKVTTMASMFKKCYALSTLDLSRFDTSNVTSMFDMFGGYQTYVDGTLVHYSNQLTTLDLSNFDTSKVTNFGYMFYECNNLTNITFSSKFTGVSATNTSTMFFNCKGLTSLDLSNFKTSSALTDTSIMFGSCNNLTTITFSNNFNTSKVTNMKRMFDACFQLKFLDLSGFNTASVTTATNMFDECHRLRRIILGVNFDFVGTDGYLPTPSSGYISGATGTWKDISTEKTYTPATLATFHNSSTVARTYQVSRNMTYTIDRNKLRNYEYCYNEL